MALCTRCNGHKRESCGICWGGQRQILCMSCSGRGFIKLDNGKTQTCAFCEGRKKFIPPSCPKCDNSYTCPDCNGAG